MRQLFTREEIKKAKELSTANLVEEKIIKPIMDRIDEKTGQKNDSRYMAYLLKFIADSDDKEKHD